MSKNIFLLDKTYTVQKDSTDIHDLIAHNQSIAENFLNLIGEENIEKSTLKEKVPTYDESIDILSRAFAKNQQEEQMQQTDIQNNFQFQQQLQNMFVGQNDQMHMQDMSFDNYSDEQYYAEPENFQGAISDTVETNSIENNADLMPTETTTQYVDTLYQEEIKESIDSKKTIEHSKKASVLVGVCIAIMAIIFTLICINVGVINNLQSSLNSTYEQYNAINAQLQASQAQLEEQLKPETIISNAMKPVDQDGLGMIMRP